MVGLALWANALSIREINQVEKVDTFLCRSDDGTIYEIEEWQRYVQQRMVDGETMRALGTRKFQTSSRTPVNPIDDNTFMIVETDTIVRRVT